MRLFRSLIVYSSPTKKPTASYNAIGKSSYSTSADRRVMFGRMLAADFILANTDRHLGNFGFLRDSETLEWKGTAPIYDSGTSLWQMTLTRAIHAEAMVPAKPFETSQQSQLKLIAPYVDLPLERLKGFSAKVEEILSPASQLDEGRAAAIAAAVDGRIRML